MKYYTFIPITLDTNDGGAFGIPLDGNSLNDAKIKVEKLIMINSEEVDYIYIGIFHNLNYTDEDLIQFKRNKNIDYILS